MLKNFGSKIISIDGTHGTNEYDFSLTTVMVVDDFGMGVPVAYCISNRENTEVFSVFFDIIKKEYGKAVEVDTFMSDDASAYIKAWTRVRFLILFRKIT